VTTFDERTALLVVDVQNDFADPGGSLQVPGGDEIVPRVNREIEAARTGRALIVYTRDWHPPSTPHFQKDGGIWPIHCVEQTWGAEFHPGLLIVDGEWIEKGQGGEDGYSAFSVRDPESGESSPTVLDGILEEHAIERVVIVGLATDYCVKETALDARRLGLATVIVKDAVAPVDLQPGDGDKALAVAEEAGAEIA
jgi:nicotinamidase/pyrazinamidase